MLQKDFIAHALYIAVEIVKVTLWQNRSVLEAGKTRKSQSLEKDAKS